MPRRDRHTQQARRTRGQRRRERRKTAARARTLTPPRRDPTRPVDLWGGSPREARTNPDG